MKAWILGVRGMAALLAFVMVAAPVSVRAEDEDEEGDGEAEVSSGPAVDPGSVILVGYLPGKYVAGAGVNTYQLAKVTITNGIITAIDKLASTTAAGRVTGPEGVPVIQLKASSRASYDVIYPGLANLHNHTTQNNMPLWADAKGQFMTRHEWRGWNAYKQAVSHNMNPWVTSDPVIKCAVFRWSELQAMVLGTTYLQGASSCVENWGIHKVEEGGAYTVDRGTQKLQGIRAPGDIGGARPAEFAFIWNVIRPKMMEQTRTATWQAALRAGGTYENALKAVIHQHCGATIAGTRINDVNGDAELAVLSKRKNLDDNCDVANAPRGFVRYVYLIHKGMAGMKKYLQSADRASIIAHLSEGRRDNPYNQAEFSMLQILGLDLPGFHITHGVGIDAAGYRHMASKQMGLIWSPFSNFLLYGETADIKAAHDAGVTIALGSDWTPTGSRGVLEELKLAREYVRKARLQRTFTDEYLYRMVTENSAKLMNHFENRAGDGRHDMGTVAVDALGTVIAVRKRETNPYTNLVLADSKDINLVVVDGKAKYGNVSYLRASGVAASRIESMPGQLAALSALRGDTAGVPAYPTSGNAAAKHSHQVDLAQSDLLEGLRATDHCNFPEEKGLVHMDSGEPRVAAFAEESGLNLDRYTDLQKLIGINAMTQSRNAQEISPGRRENALTYFPPLFSCNDPGYSTRFAQFVGTEIDANVRGRAALREEQRHRPQQAEDTLLGFTTPGAAAAAGGR